MQPARRGLTEKTLKGSHGTHPIPEAKSCTVSQSRDAIYDTVPSKDEILNVVLF